MWYIIITERDKQSPQEKEINTMKYRVYNEKNYSERMGTYLAHYTKTKREAIEYGNTVLGGNYTIERKVVNSWVAC